jgi:serine protease AprX
MLSCIFLLGSVFPTSNDGLANIELDSLPSASYVQKIHPLVLDKILSNPNSNLQVIASIDNNFDKDKIQELGSIVTEWDFIGAIVIELNSNQIDNLATNEDVNFIVLNQKTTQSSSIDEVDQRRVENAYPFSVKANEVWKEGIDGSGVTVAVIDSGINSRSGDDIGNRLLGSIEFNSNSTSIYDEYGHGTHVASIIGGNGNKSNGKYVGIAPGVNLINVKFSSHDGTASEADLIHALHWVYENKEKHNIRVVNISSSIGAIQSYKESAVAAAVEQLWFGGVVVIVSSGNDGGSRCSSCHAPANDPYVITVGAIDDNGTKDLRDDFFKPWTSHGRTIDGHMKPDVLAPGANIISYMPRGNLRNEAPERVIDRYYYRMSGTSLSAPIVTGVVALMLQHNPHLTPDQVKWIITHTTRGYHNQPRGTPGVINAKRAVFYHGDIGLANQHNIPSPFIDPSSNTFLKSNMSWSNMSWSNMSWSNVYQK